MGQFSKQGFPSLFFFSVRREISSEWQSERTFLSKSLASSLSDNSKSLLFINQPPIWLQDHFMFIIVSGCKHFTLINQSTAAATNSREELLERTPKSLSLFKISTVHKSRLVHVCQHFNYFIQQSRNVAITFFQLLLSQLNFTHLINNFNLKNVFLLKCYILSLQKIIKYRETEKYKDHT